MLFGKEVTLQSKNHKKMNLQLAIKGRGGVKV
jgi:hypothetical protein